MMIVLVPICCRFGSRGLVKKLNVCSDFEQKVWSRFWSWSSGKIWSWSLVSSFLLMFCRMLNPRWILVWSLFCCWCFMWLWSSIFGQDLLERPSREPSFPASHVRVHLIPIVVAHRLQILPLVVEDEDSPVVTVLKAHTLASCTFGQIRRSPTSSVTKRGEENEINPHYDSGQYWITSESHTSVLSENQLLNNLPDVPCGSNPTGQSWSADQNQALRHLDTWTLCHLE